MEDSSDSDGSLKSKHTLLAVIISSVGVRPHGILMAILLVDVALSFGVPVGVMSQIRSFSNIVSMAFALFM